MNAKVLERIQIIPLADVADVDAASGVTGGYVCLKDYERVLIVVQSGDGTSGNDLDVLLYQKDSAGNSKVLDVLETGRIYTKQGVDFAALVAVAAWTKETQAVADEQWTPDDSGEQCLLWAFEVMASDLDVSNGYNYIRCDLSDPGAAKIATGMYILMDPKYPAAPEKMKSGLS